MCVRLICREPRLGVGACCSAAFLVALLLGPIVASASGTRVVRVAILERGIYAAKVSGSTAVIGTLGHVQSVRNARLVESTTSIPGRTAVRFGLRYVVHGIPKGAEVELRLTTRFPDEGILTSDERRHLQSEYKMTIAIGSVGYREFQFHDVSEIIPGEWVFEFWFGPAKVGEQKFCVYDPSGVERTEKRLGCSPLVAALAFK